MNTASNDTQDASLAVARRALAQVGGNVDLPRAVEVDRGAGGATSELARYDGREGASAIWRAAAVTALGLHRALLAAAIGRGTTARLDAAYVLDAAFGHAAEHLPDARDGVLVSPTDTGSLAVQAPTAAHRELASSCAGGSDPSRWRERVSAWATARTAEAAAAELQDWGVPAFAVAPPALAGRLRPPGAEPPDQECWSPPSRTATPLRGVRVLELGGLWAAPYAAALLGDLGAEVIKIEAPTRPDGARRGPFARFAALNAGKHFCALDLRFAANRDTLRALTGPGTVVIENFTGRVLPNLGMPPAEIVSRGAVLVRLPASRASPERRGLGSTLELAAGLGRPGRNGLVTCAPLPLTDALAGLQAALAAVAALRWGQRLRVVGQLEDVATQLADLAAQPEIPGPVDDADASGTSRRRVVCVEGHRASIPAVPWRITS
jgi:hypothetical protein